MGSQMIDNLRRYLQNRPIGPILHNSKEKNDLRALKFMCVLDYYTEKLYSRMGSEPKLLQHLMQFHTYADFKYYDVQVNRAIGKLLLQCKWCELIGPYALILSHMATNHNAHIPTKICGYCNRVDVTSHLDDDSLQNCYKAYLKKYDIRVESVKTDVILDFYKLLKELAKKLDVTILRTETFAGIGYPRIEPIPRKIQNFPTTCTVFVQRSSSKKICETKLEAYFEMVVGCMFGGNGLSRLSSCTSETSDIDVIELSDDEDTNNANQTQRNSVNATRVTPNVVVKTERMDGTNGSSLNHSPVRRLPEPVLVKDPVVTQVQDATFRRVEQSPQSARLETEQQQHSAGLMNNTSATGYGQHTPQPEMNEVHKENAAQPNNSIHQKFEDSMGHIKCESTAYDFGKHVANRLLGLTHSSKRRKLEVLIQKSIVEIEQEDLQLLE